MAIDMSQQEVMQAWKQWMLERGLSEQMADWFIAKGPRWCQYLKACG